MLELLSSISVPDIHHLNIVLVIAIAVFGGTIGARFFQKLHIPQVVGYLIIGLIIGESFLNIVGRDTAESLHFFNLFALGIIGFMIGGQLKHDILKKYGKQFFSILCCEGIMAFILVGLASWFVAWHFTDDLKTSVAMALILGAIASATAPAATVNVLWEYRARGPLTTAILAIVALDDGLALLLYGFASSITSVLVSTEQDATWIVIITPIYQILGAIILGIVAGISLSSLVKLTKEADKALTFTIASVLLVIGVSIAVNVSSILAAMALGVTIANLPRQKNVRIFDLVEKFAPPIYVLFFVLAGAHLELAEATGWMIVMVVVYILCRTAGKSVGAWFGAKWSNAGVAVRKYLGLCLLSQAGVAIGLAIISSRAFRPDIANAIITIVMTSTVVVEIIGPIFVKLGIKKAGEMGLNITEEDLMKTYEVSDIMDAQPPTIRRDQKVKEILDILRESDGIYYPVVDQDGRLVGIITAVGIKETFANQDVDGWLLACDVMDPVLEKTTLDTSLEEAIELMKSSYLDHMPVVAGRNDDRLLGVLDYRAVNHKINAEVLQKRNQAEGVASIGISQ